MVSELLHGELWSSKTLEVGAFSLIFFLKRQKTKERESRLLSGGDKREGSWEHSGGWEIFRGAF